MSETEPQTAILRELQRVLHYLYDPLELRKSRFIQLIESESKDDPALVLRRAIINTIQSMKPDAKVPHEANARRIYQVLTYRFVEQSSQKEVANNLALSIRQVYRLENQAVKILAEHFFARYGLPEDTVKAQPELASNAVRPIPQTDQIKDQELEWLRTSIGFENVQVAELVDASIKTSGLLAKKLAVHIEWVRPQTSAAIYAQVTSLRQALLNLLTAGFQLASGGNLRLEVIPLEKDVEIVFQATSLTLSRPADQPDIAESIKLASNLLKLSAGTLTIEPASDHWIAKIRLPYIEQTTVLVIDDNLDALRLIERYLEESRYHFLGVRDPVKALSYAEETEPRVILLDVMLPGMDGWELLGRLREHPVFTNTPIIVTTILPQETLAVTLGAAGFLRKPFSREMLIQMLDEQTGLRAKE